MMERSGENFQRIRRISRILQRLLWVAMAIPVLAVVGYWLLLPYLPAEYQPGVRLNLNIVGPVPKLALVLAAIVSLIGAALGVAVLDQLRRLFALYESGQIFERQNVACLQNVGRLLVGGGLYRLLAHPLVSVILTWHNPPGMQQLSVQFGSGELFTILAGAIVLVIARVMGEAQELEAEQRLTI